MSSWGNRGLALLEGVNAVPDGRLNPAARGPRSSGRGTYSGSKAISRSRLDEKSDR